MMFNTLGLPAPLVQAVRAAGWTDPTAIQSKAIPVILQGNDLIGNAPSGSGKTGAFLLPGFARLLDGVQKLRALVLTPTREHATQVETQARDFSRFTDLRVGISHAGAPIAMQEKLLRESGVDVLIATVDRVLELHARKAIVFEDVEILVLDEADRMVDMGQATDIRKLLKLLPETRQTLLFSATMPAELNRLAKEALIEPVRVDLITPQPSTGITHAIYPVAKHLKITLLDRLLSRSGEVRSTIVFARQREGADRLARQLERLKYSVATLHERKSQTERERAMEDLKRGRLQIVVTTDIAARGMELGGVSHVVNFDVPPTPEDYVHRIGRAGRPDAQGDAFTLMAEEEKRHLAAIERFVGRAIPRVLLPDFDYKLKPEQVQQSVIFDDEHIRERKKLLASRMPYVAARSVTPSRPGGAAGLARPTAGIPRSVSRPAPVSTPRPKPVVAPATAKLKPRGISVRLKPVPKSAAKPTPAKPAPAKPAAKPAAAKPAPAKAAPKAPAAKPAARPARPAPRTKK